jgi:hypothetical protein
MQRTVCAVEIGDAEDVHSTALLGACKAAAQGRLSLLDWRCRDEAYEGGDGESGELHDVRTAVFEFVEEYLVMMVYGGMSERGLGCLSNNGPIRCL